VLHCKNGATSAPELCYADTYRTAPPEEPAAPPKIHRVEVEWHAVTYKTVIVYGILVAVIVLAGMFIVFRVPIRR